MSEYYWLVLTADQECNTCTYGRIPCYGRICYLWRWRWCPGCSIHQSESVSFPKRRKSSLMSSRCSGGLTKIYIRNTFQLILAGVSVREKFFHVSLLLLIWYYCGTNRTGYGGLDLWWNLRRTCQSSGTFSVHMTLAFYEVIDHRFCFWWPDHFSVSC